MQPRAPLTLSSTRTRYELSPRFVARPCSSCRMCLSHRNLFFFLLVVLQRNGVRAACAVSSEAEVTVSFLESAELPDWFISTRRVFGFACVSRVDGSASFQRRLDERTAFPFASWTREQAENSSPPHARC